MVGLIICDGGSYGYIGAGLGFGSGPEVLPAVVSGMSSDS